MKETHTYLAVFVGSPTSPRVKAWDALPEKERQAKEQAGGAAWGQWMQKHHAALVHAGGPLGDTLRVSNDGIRSVSNEMAAFVVVRATSHQAAAEMFKEHPHFTIFPGDGVEVMPVLEVPGGTGS